MKTVLIVDDSGTFQRIIEKILSPHYTISGKGSCGNHGFELFQTLRPNIVLLDITMPNCDGKECLQKIIQLDPTAKVIMVSGIGDDTTVEECLELGAKAFVKKSDISSKNTGASPLLEMVNSVLGKNDTLEAA